jgi:Zn-dependent protease
MLNWSIRLFRIAGIQLAVHSTFFLLLGYVAWMGWSAAVEVHEAGYLGALLASALLLVFFSCVVLHELGHAFAARAFGIRVPRILLLPIGGMAQMESIPKSPLKEFIIAIAGPAVNFLIIGILCCFVSIPWNEMGSFVSAIFSPASETEGPDVGWLQFLILVNFIMGTFNLIPVFPMDGGRILRAFLATRLPYVKATFVAATVAKILAVAGVCVALFWYEKRHYQLATLFAFIFVVGEMEYRAVRRREEAEERWRRTLEEIASLPIEPPEMPPRL